MGIYWKVIAGILISAILCMCVDRGIGAVLAIAVCAMGMIVALEFARPILTLMQRMEAMADLSSEYGAVLYKVMGIGLTSEVAGMLCSDTGNSAMGKMLKLLSHILILWLSIPLIESILSIIQQILGGI